MASTIQVGLKERLQETTATPEQVAEAVRIDTASRLRALSSGFLERVRGGCGERRGVSPPVAVSKR
jgi:hypothetical protein